MIIDDVFAVIAEGTRREILGSLRSGDKAVGELVDELAVSQPTVSKHLKVLREAGLVSMRAQGQKRYYSLAPEPLGEVAAWLAGFDVVQLPTTDGRPAMAAAAAEAVPTAPAVPAPAGPAATGAAPSGPAVTGPAAAGAAPAGPVPAEPAGPAVAPSSSLSPAVTAPAAAPAGSALDDTVQQQISRTVGRAAGRAADLIAHLPKLRRRRES